MVESLCGHSISIEPTTAHSVIFQEFPFRCGMKTAHVFEPFIFATVLTSYSTLVGSGSNRFQSYGQLRPHSKVRGRLWVASIARHYERLAKLATLCFAWQLVWESFLSARSRRDLTLSESVLYSSVCPRILSHPEWDMDYRIEHLPFLE